LTRRYALQREAIAPRRVYLHFDDSKCHAAWHVQDKMASHRCARVRHRSDSPDLAIPDFSMVGPSEPQLSGRSLYNRRACLKRPRRTWLSRRKRMWQVHFCIGRRDASKPRTIIEILLYNLLFTGFLAIDAV
jgi:hypothetical protein